MSAVVESFVRQVGGELRVSSETISERTGNEHRAVLQLVNSHAAALEQFGQVAFQMRPRPEGQHGRSRDSNQFTNATHCRNGHEYTPENTKHALANGGRPVRKCRTCLRLANQRRYWRLKERHAA